MEKDPGSMEGDGLWALLFSCFSHPGRCGRGHCTNALALGKSRLMTKKRSCVSMVPGWAHISVCVSVQARTSVMGIRDLSGWWPNFKQFS